MSTTNVQVAKAWSKGDVANGSTMSTDGSLIHSYALIIGVTLKDGRKIAIEHTAMGGCFHTQTTSSHVSYIQQVCDLVLTPKEYAEFIDHHDLQIPDTVDWNSRYAESKGW